MKEIHYPSARQDTADVLSEIGRQIASYRLLSLTEVIGIMLAWLE